MKGNDAVNAPDRFITPQSEPSAWQAGEVSVTMTFVVSVPMPVVTTLSSVWKLRVNVVVTPL